MTFSPDYREPVWVSVVLQFVALVFFSLLLDGGTMMALGTVAAIAYWIGAATVMLRRPERPGAVDVLYVRWGYLGLLIVAIACLPFAGVLRR